MISFLYYCYNQLQHCAASKSYVTCLLFFLPAIGFAQRGITDAPAWIVSIKAAASKQYVTDNTFSALPFSGIHAGGGVSVLYIRNTVLHELEGSLLKGNIRTNTDPEATATQTWLTFDYYNLYIVKPGELNIRLGGSINGLYAKRKYDDFINNNASNEFTASLSAAAEAAWFFEPAFCIYNRLALPVVSAVAQPEFGDKEGSSGVFNPVKAASFSSFLRIKNKLAIEKNIGERQTLCLSYTWDYYRLSTHRPVKQAAHQLALNYSFTL